MVFLDFINRLLRLIRSSKLAPKFKIRIFSLDIRFFLGGLELQDSLKLLASYDSNLMQIAKKPACGSSFGKHHSCS